MSTGPFNFDALDALEARSATGPAGLSRRAFLGLGVMTASAAMPGQFGGLSFLHDRARGRLIVSRFGSPIWTLDRNRFGGTPTLLFERPAPARAIFGLRGARLPGCDLSADFICDLQRDDMTWRALWEWTGVARPVRFHFDAWLDGDDRLEFTLLQAARTHERLPWRLDLARGSRLRLTPDWTLCTASPGAAVRLDGLLVPAERVSLALAHTEPPLGTVQGPRTRVALERGSHDWPLRLPALGLFDARVSGPPQPFTHLTLEFGEESDRLCAAAMAKGGNGIAFLPGSSYWTAVGDPFGFELDDVRYAFALESKAAALRGRAVPAACTMRAGTLELTVSPREGDAPFTWTRGSDGSATVDFHPGLEALSVPLGADVSSRIRLDPATALRFAGGGASAAARPGVAAFDGSGGLCLPLHSVTLLRPQDLLALRFEFHNLGLCRPKRRSLFQWLARKASPPLLRRLDAAQPAFVVAHFAPQHVAEKAVFEDASDSTAALPSDPVGARFAGESRLAFRIPDGTVEVPYTLAALLDWKAFEPSLVPVATSIDTTPADTALREPSAAETALELPYRLILSPNERSGWAHTSAPVARRDRSGKVTWTELWHTRLGVRATATDIDEANAVLRTVRAVHAKDAGSVNAPPPPCHAGQDPPENRGTAAGLDALSDRDHFEIVQLTSNFTSLTDGETGDPIEPAAIAVERLMLSSQGAWLSAQGNWGPTEISRGAAPIETLSLREWRQETTHGRDQYVRAVYGGFLFPYGHRANLIQITERKFQRRDPSQPMKAYLRQRIYITVEETVKAYTDLGDDPSGRSVDRQNPYRRIEVTTLVTPNLDRPSDLQYPCYFWATVLGSPFLFHFRGEDWAGQTSEFTAPIIFFNYNERRNAAAIETVRQTYESSGRWRRDLNGQKIAFAPSASHGDTHLETAFLYFSAYPDPHPPEQPGGVAGLGTAGADVDLPASTGICCAQQRKRKAAKPPWKPHAPKAEVKLPAASSLAPSASATVPIKWDDSYLRHGFTPSLGSPNFGELFAGLDGLSLPFSLPPVRSVGLFKPDFDISGLSRKFGAVGGSLDSLKLGQVDFASLFPRGRAKIFGFFDLVDLLGPPAEFGSLGGGIVPQVKTRVFYDASGLPERVENYLDWQPRLHPTSISVVTFTPGAGARANMEVCVATTVRPAGSTFRLTGRLEQFTLTIANAIEVEFRQVEFRSEDAHGLAVHVDVGPVRFLGGLAFLKKLQDKFGSSLFGGKGPRVSLEGLTVVASAGFALPNIAFGVFSLQHLKLSTRLMLPIAGAEPFRIGIDLGARNDPFLASVTIFGGGGNLSLTIGPDGVERIEFSIQAGGVVGLDLFVAHGSAYVLIGVGMTYDRTTEAARRRGLTLALFLRAGGSLDVLGLITVSVEFTLAFEYHAGDGTVTASCTVTVSIEMLFFSIDVHLTLQRTLDLGGGSQQGVIAGAAIGTAAAHAALESPAPRFEEFVSRNDWVEYCRAFART